MVIGPVDVHVMVEVSGYPTTCMHCWALGRNYRAMPIEDAAFFLDELSRFCGERGLGYATYPMHEVTAHPGRAGHDPPVRAAPGRGLRPDPDAGHAAGLAAGLGGNRRRGEGVRGARAVGRLPRLRRRARPAAEPAGRVRGDLPGGAAGPGVRAG